MNQLYIPDDIKKDFGVTEKDEQRLQDSLSHPKKKLKLLRQVRKTLDDMISWFKTDNTYRIHHKDNDKKIEEVRKHISHM